MPPVSSAASHLVDIITAADPAARNRSVDAVCRGASLEQLLDEAAALEAFRHESTNLYERVRALFFLYAIHRFHVPRRLANPIASAPGFLKTEPPHSHETHTGIPSLPLRASLPWKPRAEARGHRPRPSPRP